ncbi:hypothetical protein HZC34_04975 [Candidatus Saganbacteria bacterium]|nr:hypothetical protein [Candidatus Saganbacteria bacterium]
MEFLKRFSLFIFCVFILILFVWALYAPKQDVTKQLAKTIEEQKDRLDLLYKGVTFQETLNGVKYWEIKAKSSSINRSTSIASLEGTEGTFFEKGLPTLKFVSPAASWFMDKKEIKLKKVIGYDAKSDQKDIEELKAQDHNVPSYFELPGSYKGRGKGFFFKSENLSWNIKDKQLVCDNGLWLKKGEIAGLARKLTSDVAMEKVRISGDPKINISNGVPAMLRAKEFEVDSVRNILTAKDGVSLNANDIKIAASQAAYEQDSGNIKLAGGVAVNYKNYKATSSTALYSVKNENMVLSKDAKLFRDGSTLSGQEIFVDIKTRAFSVRGKSKIVVPEKELNK